LSDCCLLELDFKPVPLFYVEMGNIYEWTSISMAKRETFKILLCWRNRGIHLK